MEFPQELLARPTDRQQLQVFADALETHGDARGPFLALSLTDEVQPYEWARDRQLARLAAEHEVRWRAQIPFGRGESHLGLRRGILSRLFARGSDRLHDWQSLIAKAPVSAVTFDASGYDTMYADVNVLNTVDSLTYDFSTFARFGGFGSRAPNLKELTVHLFPFQGPFVYDFDGALESLHVREGAQSQDSIDAMTRHARLSGLRRLNLTIDQVEAPRVAAALGRWRLDRLSLVLRRPLGTAGLLGETLVQSLSSLSLDLHDAQFINRETAFRRPWPRLRHLKLPLSGSSLAVATMEALESVEHLEVSLDDDAAEALSARPLTALRSLVIRADRGMTGRGVAALLRAEWALTLERLELNRLQVDAAALEALGRAQLPKLQQLTLLMTRLGDDGLARLGSATLPALEHLNVDYALWPTLVRMVPSLSCSLRTLRTGMTERDELLRLLSSDRVTSLRSLDLSGPELDPEVQRALVSGQLDGLETLVVTSARIEQVGALVEHFGERLVVLPPQSLL